MEQPTYEREGATLSWRRSVTDDIGQERIVTIKAAGVHRERTSVYAKMSILVGPVTLAWDTICIDRNADRTHLLNEAYPHFNGLSTTLPKAHLKHEIDLFCEGLWDASVQVFMPQLMPGSLDPKPPSFLLSPYILEGGGTIIFGPPGRGKSYVMLLMSVSIDAGLQELWPSQHRRVLFINLERGAQSVADRLGNVNKALVQPPDRPLLTLNARGKSLVDVWDGARRAVVDYQVDCVMLDSISRTGAGDLNENVAGNSTIDAMNALCDTWVALGHSPRADESHLYGSQMFDAGADVMVQLLSQQEEGGPLGIGLQITKSNDVGKQAMQMVALEFGPAGLTRVRPAIAAEFPEVAAGRKQSMREKVIEYLLENGSTSASKIAQDLGINRSNTSTLLSKDAAFIEVGKHGASVLYGVQGRSA